MNHGPNSTCCLFGYTEGDKIASEIYDEMINDGIHMDKMVSLVHDGPNVNKLHSEKMSVLIMQDYPEFLCPLDHGSCTIYTIHNAFGKCIKQYGKDKDQLNLYLY